MVRIILTIVVLLLAAFSIGCTTFQIDESINDSQNSTLEKIEDPYEDYRCENRKVMICHREEGKNPKEICVNSQLAQILLDKEGTLGECPEE